MNKIKLFLVLFLYLTIKNDELLYFIIKYFVKYNIDFVNIIKGGNVKNLDSVVDESKRFFIAYLKEELLEEKENV